MAAWQGVEDPEGGITKTEGDEGQHWWCVFKNGYQWMLRIPDGRRVTTRVGKNTRGRLMNCGNLICMRNPEKWDNVVAAQGCAFVES